MSPISIIGAAQTPFGEHWDLSVRDLMQQAIDNALDDAQINPLEVDMIIVANMLGERVNDQAHMGSLASSMLAHRPPALRVEAACASGSVAMHTAMSILESGRAETILVVGAEKMTDADNQEISAALMGASDAEYDSECGLTFAGIFGMIAQRYMHDFALTRDQLSTVSVMHHAHAKCNPNAQFRNPLTPEIVSSSTEVADPLRLLDCSPISDGAAACILSMKHDSDCTIAASQMSTDTLSITKRPSITSFSATKEAMEHALTEAGIERSDISCMEIHDCFSIAAILHLEDMGFAPLGTGIDLYTNEDINLAINASGGLKACGHPVGATGVKQVSDIRKQLRSTQNKYGLTHNIGGAGATCAIHIIEHSPS